MSKIPRISAIMAVYNTKEEWLKESIESILNQTYSDFEFIIINDGSTNNVENVILSYKDERIKYIKQENQGLAKSLNNGLDIAKGEYIARMDSDDISLPERFEKQVKFLDENLDISIVGTSHEYFPNGKIAKMLKYPKYIDFLKGNSIGHPTVMFRRADFEKYDLKYNPEYLCEDYELWSRAIKYLKFANIQEILLKYRWHENNLSKPNEKFEFSVRKVRQNMLDFLTTDTTLQNNIITAILPNINKNTTFIQKIFSIKNNNDKTKKIIRILGLKIIYKRN